MLVFSPVYFLYRLKSVESVSFRFSHLFKLLTGVTNGNIYFLTFPLKNSDWVSILQYIRYIAGVCLFLTKKNSVLDIYDCRRFTSGCPGFTHFTDKMYECKYIVYMYPLMSIDKQTYMKSLVGFILFVYWLLVLIKQIGLSLMIHGGM